MTQGDVARTGAPLALRRDLQGGRGIGILFVLTGHLWHWPHGAFALLEMFFVLSGYLITELLVTYLERYGAIALAVFYLRRARRLLPAAIAVIVATTGFVWLMFPVARAKQVTVDGLWALGFGSNWHSIASGSDYFNDPTPSPFVHYWTLSLEEQFYLVWPALLLLGLVVARRRRWSPRVVLTLGISVIGAASLAYSAWHSATEPAAAYFSTFDRVWAFAAGALVAVTSPWWSRIPRLASRVVGWVGVVGLVASGFLVHHGMAYPVPWAVPTVVFAAMFIAGGVHHDPSRLPLLTWRPLVFLGDLSYSIYLAQVPIVVLLPSFVDAGSVTFYALAVTATAVASGLLYYLVEKPMRRAPWLMTPRERAMQTDHRPFLTYPQQITWVGVVVGVSVGAVLLALQPLPGSGNTATAARGTQRPWDAPARPTTLGPVAELRAEVAAAAAARTFPTFDPPLDQVDLDHLLDHLRQTQCVNVPADDVQQCRTGPADGKHLAVVFGDSTAMTYVPGIQKALEPRGWQVQQLTMLACPAWTLGSYLTTTGEAFPACADHHELLDQVMAGEHPDLVILESSSVNERNLERPGFGRDGVALARTALGATLRQLSAYGTRVVVLAPPPLQGDLNSCVTRVSTPSRCRTQPTQMWDDQSEGEQQAARQWGADYVQTLGWFCSADVCPGFVDGIPVTVGGGHLTWQYAEHLAPVLRRALLRR